MTVDAPIDGHAPFFVAAGAVLPVEEGLWLFPDPNSGFCIGGVWYEDDGAGVPGPASRLCRNVVSGTIAEPIEGHVLDTSDVRFSATPAVVGRKGTTNCEVFFGSGNPPVLATLGPPGNPQS